MATKLNPYLSFRDNARQAMEFYQSVFGGKLDISTFDDLHAAETPDEGQLVMHSTLTTDNDLTLMGADTPKRMTYTPGNDVSLSLNGDDEAELRGYWDKLTDGAEIRMPLEKAQWGDTFGMLTDKFGMRWMVNIAGQHPAAKE